MQNISALVLAAGKGTRMRGSKAKVMQTLLGSPMLAYPLAAMKPLFGENIIVVSGQMAETLEAAFPNVRFTRQAQQLGTGHAVLSALPALESLARSHVFIINGDVPLVTTEAISYFLKAAEGADLAFATITLDDPGAYGRVVRRGGRLGAIIEAKDYDIVEHGAPTGEVNAGLYYMALETARSLLPRLKNANKSGEYYLTDLVGLGIKDGLDVRGIDCGNDASLLGVNTPFELASAEDILADRVSAELLEKGVILHAPHLLRASPFAIIEPGAEISCPCDIQGASRIYSDAVIDQYCVIIDSDVHAGARVKPFSHLERAIVGSNAIVGPYTRLRPGAELAQSAHAGNFVELKNARLGEAAKANHLAYLGDAEIGAGANIGAGTITCNYDGKQKHRTVIGERAFIGSNTALVAPVSVGSDALVGAGSVITMDVPSDNLAIGRARQSNMARRKK